MLNKFICFIWGYVFTKRYFIKETDSCYIWGREVLRYCNRCYNINKKYNEMIGENNNGN